MKHRREFEEFERRLDALEREVRELKARPPIAYIFPTRPDDPDPYGALVPNPWTPKAPYRVAYAMRDARMENRDVTSFTSIAWNTHS